MHNMQTNVPNIYYHNNWTLQKIVNRDHGAVSCSLYFAITPPPMHEYATIYRDLRFFELLEPYRFLLCIPHNIFDMTLPMIYFFDQDLGKGKSKLSWVCLFHNLWIYWQPISNWNYTVIKSIPVLEWWVL